MPDWYTFARNDQLLIISCETDSLLSGWFSAYIGLFAWSFAAATLVPLDASFALAGLVYARRTVLLPVIIATTGNVLGACTTYWLARRAAQLRTQPGRWEQQGLRWMQRYGAPLLLAAWVPLLGDVLVAAAGAARIAPRPFLFWTTLGKAARYLLVAWATLAALA